MKNVLKRYYQAVKFTPCLACGKPGPSEAAHISVFLSSKTGFQKPRSHKGPAAFGAIPLCYECHRGQKGIHSGSETEWLEKNIDGGVLEATAWIATTLATILYNECE